MSASIVLVHGAWHGAWCYAALQHALDESGVPSYSIDLPGHGTSTMPLGDLHCDARYVAQVLDAIGEPVVLVGHSYGGAVITEAAASREDVTHLVYLAAFALNAGESVTSLLASLPRARVQLSKAIRKRDDGTSVLDPAMAADGLYGDCSKPAIEAALPRLGPQPMITFTDCVSASPRSRIASTYVRCTRDEAIHITHQNAMAARCDAVVSLDTGHSPFMSRTADTADILRGLARRR